MKPDHVCPNCGLAQWRPHCGKVACGMHVCARPDCKTVTRKASAGWLVVQDRTGAGAQVLLEDGDDA